MLTTTRREIVNDYDVSQNRRLGSFSSDFAGEETTGRFQDDRYDGYKPAENYLSRNEIAQKLYGQNYTEEIGREQSDANDYSDPDLMPSRETMQITRSASYYRPQMTETKSAVRSKYTTRSKILIASYAAVLLALALIITLTTVSIASLFSDVNRLEVQLNNEIETVAMLDESIAEAGSAEVIIDKAASMGMTTAGSAGSFEIPSTKPASSGITAGGNWFDGFSDWVSDVFGG